MKEKINLMNLDREELKNFFSSINEHPFRAKQIMHWIYHKQCNKFHHMNNISKKLKNKLNSTADIIIPTVKKELHSSDGTIKWILKIEEQEIETVYIPQRDRSTLCISSQIGCAVGCKFCLTSRQGFSRNLTVSEIIGQIWNAKKIIKLKKNLKITNVVMMGMGEPLLNIKNIISSIKIINDSLGFNISKRHITISTSGILPAIKMLKKVSGISLAISLHAPDNYTRSKIMPINKKYRIKELLLEINKYVKNCKKYNKFFTVEYIMINNINDTIQHANKLISILKGLACKINLIPLNTFHGLKYQRSKEKTIMKFAQTLKRNGFITTVRRTRGEDIGAACGQLSGLVIKK